VSEDRTGRGREQSDADDRHRIAGEERDEIARNDFAAPVGGRYAVDHFEAAAVAEAAGDPAGRGRKQHERQRLGDFGEHQQP